MTEVNFSDLNLVDKALELFEKYWERQCDVNGRFARALVASMQRERLRRLEQAAAAAAGKAFDTPPAPFEIPKMGRHWLRITWRQLQTFEETVGKQWVLPDNPKNRVADSFVQPVFAFIAAIGHAIEADLAALPEPEGMRPN